VRANDTTVDGLVSTNSQMTSLNSSSITTIGCGMWQKEREVPQSFPVCFGVETDARLIFPRYIPETQGTSLPPGGHR